MKKLLLLLFFFLIIPIKINASEYEITNVYGYGTEYIDSVNNITKTSDDKIILCGTSYISNDNYNIYNGIIKLYNKDYSIIWEKLITTKNNDGGVDVFSTQEVSDGYIFVGRFSKSIETSLGTLSSKGLLDLFIMKYSKNGTLLWQRSYGGTGYDGINESIKIKELPNHNIIINLLTQSSEISIDEIKNTITGTYNHMILFLMNSDTGSFVKQIKLNYDGKNDINDILPIDNENVLITGSSSSTNMGYTKKGLNDAFIGSYNINNESMNWVKNIGITNGNVLGYNLMKTSDNNYVAVGFSEKGGIEDITSNSPGYSDGWIVKISPTGDILWENIYSSYYRDNIIDVKEDRNNNYFVTGYTYSKNSDETNNQNILIATFNSDDGTLLSSKSIQPTNDINYNKSEVGKNLITLDKNNNEFLIIGDSYSNFDVSNYQNKGKSDIVFITVKEKKYSIEYERIPNDIFENKKYFANDTVQLIPNSKYSIKNISIINKNTNEKINITDNKFIMPNSDVLINVKYELVIENPKTKDNTIIYLILLIFSFINIIFIQKTI